MKYKLLSGCAAAMLALSACAQVTVTDTPSRAGPVAAPMSAPTNVNAGGSAEARAALAQLVAERGFDTRTLQGLEGPAGPATYTRSDIALHSVRSVELPGVSGYFFRTSIVEVKAGDVVPVHSHAGRPAIATVLSGAVTHHGSDGKSFEIKAGEATPSAGGLAEWWHNKGDQPATIWIVDLCGAAHGCTDEDVSAIIDLGGVASGPVANPPMGEGPSKAEVLIEVALANEFPDMAAAIGDRQLRLRRVEWAPGRIVPPHNHATRPNYIWIQQGAFTAYDPSGQRVINDGSVVLERGAVEGAWKNNGDETVVLYAVDIVNPAG